MRTSFWRNFSFFFFFLCVWFCVLTSFWGGKPSLFQQGLWSKAAAQGPQRWLPAGTGPSVSFMLWSWYSQFPQEINGKCCVSRPTSAPEKLDRHWCPLQFKQPVIVSFWAELLPGQNLHEFIALELAECPLHPQSTLQSKRRSGSAPCQALTSGKWVLTSAFKAIQVHLQMWHLELQMNAMKGLEGMQHNCSEYGIMHKTWRKARFSSNPSAGFVCARWAHDL